jgi:hypothetical protein
MHVYSCIKESGLNTLCMYLNFLCLFNNVFPTVQVIYHQDVLQLCFKHVGVLKFTQF